MKVCACVLLFTIFAFTNPLPDHPDKNINLGLETVLRFDNNKYQTKEAKFINIIQKVIDRLKNEIDDDTHKSKKHSRRSFDDNQEDLEDLGHKIIERLNYLESQIAELKQDSALRSCSDKNQTGQCVSRSSNGIDENNDAFVKKGSLRHRYNITDGISNIVIKKCDKCNVSRLYRKILKTDVRKANESVSLNHILNASAEVYHEELKPHYHHDVPKNVRHSTEKSSDEMKVDEAVLRSNDTQLSSNEKEGLIIDSTKEATETTVNISLETHTSDPLVRNFSSTFPLVALHVANGRKSVKDTAISVGNIMKDLTDTKFDSDKAKNRAVSKKIMDLFSLPNVDKFLSSNVW